MVSSDKTLIVITGPTAVGKTQLCLDIAKHFDIPIINADSRQIYKELSIGTAKPSAEEQQQIKHYFVGALSLEDYYSASLFETQVMELLSTLFKTSDYALMAGGSMMYIDAVCEIVDRQNPKRVVHALEICTMTGRTYTSFRKREKKERPFRIVKIGLNREREELYNRINARVDEMIQKGLLKEAESVYSLRELNALNTVGYKELFDYFDGRWPLEEAVERIKGNTRRYARKQLTWYKKDKQIRWFHPDEKTTIIDYIITESR